jgi:hypothetical protein
MICSLIAILVCAVAGTALAWLILEPLGFTGVAAALSVAFLAMVFATAGFALLVTLGKALKILK